MPWGLTIALALAPAALAVALVWASLRRCRRIEEEPRDVLIVAAHQDDCAIVAGEYAMLARAAGRTVRIAYLTCGAASPDSIRATTRRDEALLAWSTIGVPPSDVYFHGLPEHALSSEATWSEVEQDAARHWLRLLLDDLPARAVVFLPAAGELHVDHRNLRRLVLEAWERSRRDDLQFMEAPEYNDYLSLIQAPKKVVIALALSLPVVSRWMRRRWSAPWPGFPTGGPPWRLPPDSSRLARRHALLRAFASEDGEKLVGFFGWHERYRPVSDAASGLDADPPPGYVLLGTHHRGYSAILFLVVLVEATSLLAAQGSAIAIQLAGAALWARGLAIGAAAAAAARCSRRHRAVETRLFYGSLAVGAVLAALEIV